MIVQKTYSSLLWRSFILPAIRTKRGAGDGGRDQIQRERDGEHHSVIYRGSKGDGVRGGLEFPECTDLRRTHTGAIVNAQGAEPC